MIETAYHAFVDIPVLYKILGALGCILILNAYLRQLGVSIATGAILLAFWSGHSLNAALDIAWTRFTSLDNICLLIIVFQVIWLSNLMKRTGAMAALVLAVRARVSHRKAIAALPAIIGMLPMPGGAIFSAPLVDDCDTDKVIDPLLKTRINYWFRHIWEYWWPLYPGVLLAIEISNVDIWQFTLVQFPMSVLAVGVGAWFLLRKVPCPEDSGEQQHKPQDKPLLPLLAPVITVVIVYALVRVCFPQIAAITRYAPMIAGLAAGILILQLQHPLGRKEWKEVLTSKRTFTMAALVALVRIYGAFIESELPNGHLLIDEMRLELAAGGVPVTIIIMAVPFLSGLATGIAVGFIGASFPIVFSLLGTDPGLAETLPTIVLAFGFGYMGMILSPVHICLIVTNEHFSTRIMKSLRGLMLPALTMLTCVTAVYALCQLLF
mgnify:FL=1